jgi:hypothetical protein
LNFIITGLNEKYWNPWGISWLASLRDLAQTQSKPVIIDFGLSYATKEKIKSFDAIIHEGNKDSTIRNASLNTIAKLANEIDGNFVYYDADFWFQKPIDEVFDMIEDNLLMTKNKNPGFVGGNSISWKKYGTVHNMTAVLKDHNKTECMLKFFESEISFIDNKYNFINLPDLKDNKNNLIFHDIEQLAIHPTGILKKLCQNKSLLFSEKHKELFEKYAHNKKVGVSRRLVKNIRLSQESEN